MAVSLLAFRREVAVRWPGCSTRREDEWARRHTRPDAEVYAWSLRDPLPAIRIPLRAPDPDLVLDLSAVYEETFHRGRYGRKLRYGQPLSLPLPPAAAQWIAERAEDAVV